MRFSNVFLGLSGAALSGALVVAASSLAACSSSSSGAGGSGGGTGSTTGTGAHTGSTSGSSYACSPSAACKVVDDSCLGEVDNTGKTTFGLRISELDVTKPAVMTQGLMAGIISGDIQLSLPACHVKGSGTFSWLLQFDTTAKTLKTGGAPPVADPTAGYSFTNTTISGMQIAPATFTDITIAADGSFTNTSTKDFQVPVYLSATDTTQVVILPLKHATIATGKLSASHNCIGEYNAAGLKVTNLCQASTGEPQFISAGTITALITLEDADQVIVAAAQQSLCAILAGTGTTNSAGVKVCNRDAGGKNEYQGDTCSTIGGTCKDSDAFVASYAASSIKINN